jgi:hypothetical protein
VLLNTNYTSNNKIAQYQPLGAGVFKKNPMHKLPWIISIALVMAAADGVVGHARPKHICEKADSSAAVVALGETTSKLQATEDGLATFLTSFLYLIDKGNVLCSSHNVRTK